MLSLWMWREYNMCMQKYGQLTTQIIELLATRYPLSFVYSRSGRREIYQRSDKIWFSMDRKLLFAELSRLRLRGLIKVMQSKDIYKLDMTRAGFTNRLKRQFKMLQINKPRRWDKVWRLVMFDVPESLKPHREILRNKLKKLGFAEFQKSVFAYPYPCNKEINYVINFLEISEYVWYLETKIQPDKNLRIKFNL